MSQETRSVRPAQRQEPPAPRDDKPAPRPRPPGRMAAVAYSELIARVFRSRRSGDDTFAIGSLLAGQAEPAAAEAQGLIAAIDAAGGAREALAGPSQAAMAFDIAPLRERIGRCLALHANMTHAWSVATRLRRDVAPASHLLLSCDSHGRLSLCLSSALPHVVGAMQGERPALAAVLAEWSAGEPDVDVRLVEVLP